MKLCVTFAEQQQTFNDLFEEDSHTFDVNLGQIQHVTEYVGGDPFGGEYVITPKVEAQTMPTKTKVMLDDVTIMAIPYSEVTNNSNGKTVTIG